MASNFPNAIDAFATNRSDATPMATTHASDHNNENDAINKIEAFLIPALNTQTASYTLVLGDTSKVVEMNVAAANNLTVPPNSSVAYPVGAMLEICQMGAGQTTLVPGTGVTLRSPGGKLKLVGQYSSAGLRKRATDEWVVAGELAT